MTILIDLADKVSEANFISPLQLFLSLSIKNRPQGDLLITPLIDSARQELSVDGHIVFGLKISPAASIFDADSNGPIGNLKGNRRKLNAKFSSTGRFGRSQWSKSIDLDLGITCMVLL